MILEKDPWNLIITGVGGQGNVLASQLLGQMLVEKGYIITIGETYGASQRGGSVMSHIRISSKDQFSPIIPGGQVDFVMGLEPIEVLRVLAPYGNPGTMALVNTRPIHPIEVISGEAKYPTVDHLLQKISSLCQKVWILNATDAALEMGDPIYSNIIMLGALCAIGVLPLDEDGFQGVMAQLMSPSRQTRNLEAFRRGTQEVRLLS